MTNQEKFIQIFGIDAWQQMIVFCGLAEQFKEYWTSPYNEMNCRDCKEKMSYNELEELKTQDSIFGKIRSEIEQKIVRRSGLSHTRSERDRNDAFLEVLDIIDKCRKEQEE